MEIRGEREGNIERVRQWRCCAFRSPPSSALALPEEGRTVTRGVHHAQHRLLDVEVMMLVINWRCALRYPLSRVLVLLGGRRVTGSAITTQLAPRLPAAVGSAASEVMMLGSGEFVMLLLRCCLLLMVWLLVLLLLLRPRGRAGAR